jgi:hypothetical protein
MPTKPGAITTVRLPDDILVQMAKLQARDGIGTSEQIRRALRDWLAKKLKKR